MDSATSHIRYPPESFLSGIETSSRNVKDKRSPTEVFHMGKVDGIVQECKNSPVLFNKTDGQAKSFYNNLHLPVGRDNSPLINRSFEKSRNNSDNFYDLGVTQDSNDGTDSGIELIRALSSNGSNSDRFTPIQSCGSSLVSYSSEPEADRGSECESESSEKSRVRKGSNCSSQSSTSCWKSKKTYERSRITRKTNGYDGEGTSESCSETSSTHEAVTPDQLTRSIDFKRSTSNRLHESKRCEKSKPSTIRRSESSTRNSSHDKVLPGSHGSARSSSSVRSSSATSKACTGSKSYSVSRSVKSTAASKCEVKGSKSKSEDDRWSSQRGHTNGARNRVSSAADPSRKMSLNSMSCSMTSSFSGSSRLSEGKSNALDKYGTLPRRAKKKSGESLNLSVMQTSMSRSHSVTREPSLNRAATLRRQQSKEKENASNCRSLPPYPRTRRGTGKIIIYHEIGVQTVITSEDISSSSSGVSIKDKPTEVTSLKESKGIQTEAKERLKKIEEDYRRQCEEIEKAKTENEELKMEKQKTISRICKLLGYPESKQAEMGENALDELEKHFQAVGLTVMKQQEELSELHHCRVVAHRDLEKSLAAQKNLLQQQQEIEEEYSELQEFLQAEKTALSESLLDMEQELCRLRDDASKKQRLLEQQEAECKHLVRICEQRRQENLSLEAKLAGVDQRSRDVLVQQGAAASAAAVALSGLGARLDSLVEQLSVSCNIKEKDLEDVVFHNEVYNKTEDNSPDEMPSKPHFGDETKRRGSFIQVIMTAIKNAAQSSFPSAKTEPKCLPDQNETFLDLEVERNLNFENGLEENSLSTFTDQEKEEMNGEPKDGTDLSRSDSLQKLSHSILNRQMVEEKERCVSLNEIIPIEVNSLVDQIVDVDNLLTKLLKVIRIIQGETQRQVEELQNERQNLTGQFHQEKKNVHKLESNLKNLQMELTDARRQINTRISQLEEVKALCRENQELAALESQKRFAIIDSALGALSSVQDVVNQYTPLAKLQYELKDCNLKSAVSDVNANSAANENGLIEDAKHKGAVLTTAI